MAILAIFTSDSGKSQYEELRREVNGERQQPEGVVLHVADVWESADAMNAFVEQHLMPAIKKLGIAPPEVAVYPVHNLNAYESIEKHKI